jgi:hypothetical protein
MKLNLKVFIKACSLLFIISCTNSTNDVGNNEGYNATEFPSTQEAQPIETKKTDPVIVKSNSKLSIAEVDLKSIKKSFLNFNTSGKLSKKDSKNYLPKKQVAFYGVYYFTKSNSQIPYIGKAVVACQEQNGWDYINELEELVEFCTFSNKLNPFIEIVQIGQTKKDVIGEFGNDFKEIDNNLMYTDTVGNVISILINNDTVRAVKVGRYEKIQEVSPIVIKW